MVRNIADHDHDKKCLVWYYPHVQYHLSVHSLKWNILGTILPLELTGDPPLSFLSPITKIWIRCSLTALLKKIQIFGSDVSARSPICSLAALKRDQINICLIKLCSNSHKHWNHLNIWNDQNLQLQENIYKCRTSCQ